MARVLFAALAVLACAGPAWAQGSQNNPIVQAYGADIALDTIEVRYNDGILPSHQDNAVETYIRRRLDDTRRAEFQALAQPRGLNDETSAERFSEYLTERDLRARSAQRSNVGPRVNMSIQVIGANAPGMMSALVPGAQIIPTLTYEFTITDAASGASLANGRVDDVYSLAFNINDARRRNELEYNFSGTDQNFRTLAGQTNALADSVMTLISGSLIVSGGRSSIGTAYTTAGAFDLTTQNARYRINITPPPPPAPAAPPPEATPPATQ